MFMKQNTDSEDLKNNLFPRKIILNFAVLALVAAVLFFFATFYVNIKAKERNEKVFRSQQVIQSRVSAQAIEENLDAIFYNIDILRIYCRDLFNEEREVSNSFFQLVQTGRQEVAAFMLIDNEGRIRYRNIALGNIGNDAQKKVLEYLELYSSEIRGGLSYVPPLYIDKDMQLMIKLLPAWQDGKKAGVMGVAIDIGNLIRKYSFITKLGFTGNEVFLDKNGTVISEANISNIGKNVKDITLDNISTGSLPLQEILSQPNGSHKYKLFDSVRRPHNVLVAWDSVDVMGEKIIVVTGSSEKVVNRAIQVFHKQSLVLGILVATIIGVLCILLILSRKAVVRRSLIILEDTVNERTRELNLSEKKYQAVFHGVSDALVVVRNGRISYFNESTLSLLGYTAEELKGQNPIDFVFEAYEEGMDNLSQYKKYAEDAFAGKPVMFETILICRSGALIYADVSMADMEDKESLILTLRDITSRKKAEKALVELNVQLEKRVSVRTMELEKANEALKESLETLKKTQQSLVEAGKMASLGVLVAGVAHEVNTPVGIGVTAASYLREQTSVFEQKYRNNQMKRSDLEAYVNTASDTAKVILDNLARASERISSFKQVAVDQTNQENRLFKLKAYIEEVLISIQPAYKKTKHSVIITGDDSVEMLGSPGAISQIITNLVMNSLKHGFEGVEHGTMTIDVSRKGEMVEIRYADNGIGMTEEVVSKIFDPFFTTKRGSGGSGLGMNIVYNLVTRSLKGDIVCRSRPGEGSEFIIKFPGEIE